MSTGLPATFQFLTATENEAALDILIAGIDSTHQPTRDRSLRAIMERLEPRGHEEVFRRLPKLDEHSRSIVSARPDRLVKVVTPALQEHDPKACKKACEAIVAFRLCDALPALLSVMSEAGHPNADRAVDTVLKLTQEFYGELSGPDDNQRKDIQNIRARITASLEDATRKYGQHQRDEIVEAFLLVAKQQNATLRNMLQRSEESSHEVIVRLLLNSQRGGVVRLLLGFLDDPQAPLVIFKVLAERKDIKFVEHFLRTVGSKPTRAVTQSLGRLEKIAWLTPGSDLLDKLDDEYHEVVVQVALASGLKHDERFQILAHMLTHGKAPGRRAAAEALQNFKGAEADSLVIKSLNDEDPYVRAHLIRQLRPRQIPNALLFLIRMVGTTHEALREALRESMPEFSFRNFLKNLDAMEEELRPMTGHLVRQIDPGCAANVKAEMESLSPVRRRRAVNAAGAMGIVPEIENEAIKLLSDDDHTVRVAAAKALSECKSMPSWEALRDSLLDKSFLVQEAAVQSLERISTSLLQDLRQEQGNPEENEEPTDSEEVAP